MIVVASDKIKDRASAEQRSFVVVRAPAFC